VDARFIVDINVGKLARWLRIIGYDTLLFNELDDGRMVKMALADGRIILTRDTQFIKRRAITSGKVKALLVEGEYPEEQLKHVITTLNLDYEHSPFSLCLECNCRLVDREKEDLKNIVPPYVYKTQEYFKQCPECHRIYWQGTHWLAMNRKLSEFTTLKKKGTGEMQ
jgi:uncharacterized protein with PIN domain